jgi:HAD superfamily hydrolase (TIGR01490 family)
VSAGAAGELSPEGVATAGAPPSGRGAAFFDLDRTLMAGASAYHFGRALHKAGRTTRRQLARDGVEQLRFRLQGATDAAVNALLDRVREQIGGWRVEDLMRLTPDVLAGILPRIYPQMMDVVRWHQDEGRPCLIATAASQNLVDILAEVLQMDGAVGTRWEVRDGVITGELDGPFAYGEGKARAVRRVAAEQGIDLSASWAYTDSASDLPMLEAVGHPVAVNPDAPLAEIARREGWEVLRFEKLGQRLQIAAGVLAAGAVGGSGTWLAARRRARAQAPGRGRIPFPPRSARRARGGRRP